MTNMSKAVLRLRADRVEWRLVEDEIVALTLEGDRYLGTNRTGALLWQALVDGSDVERLARLLESEGAVLAEAQSDVIVFLDALRQHGLLAE
ncbi:MAG: PqqD family protein [Actinomycetota bacterium]|nr:PqqD family protein [Actinomycetota bacterium]